MSRRNQIKKHYSTADLIFKSYLVNLLILRLLKKGKKRLAERIILETFSLIKKRTFKLSIKIFEKAVRNTTPLVEVKPRTINGSTYQIPTEVRKYRGTTLALRWIINAASERSGKTMVIKLSNEIIDASKNIGNAVKKCQEIHKMAKANKAFIQFNSL